MQGEGRLVHTLVHQPHYARLGGGGAGAPCLVGVVVVVSGAEEDLPGDVGPLGRGELGLPVLVDVPADHRRTILYFICINMHKRNLYIQNYMNYMKSNRLQFTIIALCRAHIYIQIIKSIQISDFGLDY